MCETPDFLNRSSTCPVRLKAPRQELDGVSGGKERVRSPIYLKPPAVSAIRSSATALEQIEPSPPALN